MMKCSVVLVLWVLLDLVQGGALRCVPGEDSVCAADNLETVHPARIGKALSGKVIEENRGVYCLIGSKWDSTCGKCSCSEFGRAQCERRAGCTATDEDLEKQCAPDTMWLNDCNSCWCSDQGRAMCTRIGCAYVTEPTKETQSEEKPSKDTKTPVSESGVDHVEHHMVCAARGTFYIGCNTCHCNPLGTDYSCSNKPCPLPEDVELFHELKTLKSSTNRSTKQVCVANRMFIKDCNTCWCNDDGTSFYCTRKVCVPDLPEPGQDQPEELRLIKKECRPNEVFELDCNMCRCNPDGNSYSCTRRACVDMDHHDQPVVEPVVQDAKLLAAQNTKVDPVDVLDQSFAEPVQDIKVVPVVQDTKNLPTVSASVVEGKEVLPIDEQVVQPVDQPMFDVAVKDAENQPLVRKSRATEEKQCNPGQNFRLDCNICLCDNTGTDFSCTRHDCNAPNGGDLSRSKRETSESSVENVTMQCVAGSVFDRECNVCRCAEGGERALCTHKPCSPRAQPLAIDSVTNAPESDPNFRCNPGEQLKRGCNDCQCSADGRSVFCTVRFCDQDITPPPSTV